MYQERGDLAVTDEHAREGSQQPTRETATGGASRVVLEYRWASPQGLIDPSVGFRDVHPVVLQGIMFPQQ